jgi:hypothetical protein
MSDIVNGSNNGNNDNNNYPSKLITPAPPYDHPRMDHFSPVSRLFIDHPSQAKPGIHAYPDRLYVLTMLENPLRWRSRYANYSAFERMVEESGAILYTAEVAFENRLFEITRPDNPRHLQLRGEAEVWHKENVLNLLAQRLPSDWQKVAVLDADVEFARRDWAQEILHSLAHYDVIQPFSHAINLDADGKPSSGEPPTSFLYKWVESGIAPHSPDFMEDRPVRWSKKAKLKENSKLVTGIPQEGKKQKPASVAGNSEAYPGVAIGVEVWHPGLAWAYRRSAWDKLGGLMDWLVTGSGDWHGANALIGQLMDCIDPRHTNGYKRWCQIWQDRAIEVRDNPEGGLGYMPGLLLHRYHGTHKNRQYQFRHEFVINCGFDPDLDLKRDSTGLWQLCGRNPKLRDGLRAYNRLRNEDGE